MIFGKKKVENTKEKKKEKKIKRGVDAFSLRRYKDSIMKYLPYDIAIDNRTVLSKYGGFMRFIKIKNFDTNYLDNAMIDFYLKSINDTFKRLSGNVVIHYEVQREKIKPNEFKSRPNAPIPTQLCNYVRHNKFKNTDIYKNSYYITFTYINRTDTQTQLQDIILNNKNVVKKLNDVELMKICKRQYDEFEESFSIFMGGLKEFSLDYEILEGSDITNYLSKCVNPLNEANKIPMPPMNYQIDEVLPQFIYDDLEHFKIGDTYVKIISPTLYPTEVNERFFGILESLNFPIRLVHRIIMLDKEDAISIITKTKQYQDAKKTSFFQNIVKAIDKDVETPEDDFAIEMSADAHSSLKDLRGDIVSYGYYSFTIIIEDKDLDKLTEKSREILSKMSNLDIVGIEDKYNSLDAYMGAMPGNIVSNVRRLPINTYAWSYLVPTSEQYIGEPKTKHRNDDCLLTTTTTNNELFYFDNLVGDVGHSLILGVTGSGKSVLLSTMALNMLKYNNSQVFIFDVGGSSRVLTESCGGKFYDLGDANNRISFQPLRNIDKPFEKSWAIDWIISLIYQENKSLITPENKILLNEAMNSLASRPIEDRTITNFVSFVQNQDIKIALQPYTMAGNYGVYFDGNKEEISDAKIITFEMNTIMQLPQVISPALSYLFHIIEVQKLNQGKPSMLLLDECWLFLKNEQISGKILEWLKVLRKKNASVVFATQSGADILNSSLKDTILDQCLTKIFLPNPNARGVWGQVYDAFNLNQKEIQTIANATPKREYFVKTGFGTQLASALFTLNLSPLELIYVGASTTPEQDAMKIIVDNTSDIFEMNKTWIRANYNNNKISEQEYNFANNLIDRLKEYYNNKSL